MESVHDVSRLVESVPGSRRSEFEQFVLHRSARLLRFAYLLEGDAQAAEDLVQEALARLWFAWSRIEGDPEPFARRTLLNRHLSQRRRRWRGELPSDSLPEVEAVVPDHPRDLLRALAKLPARQRAVVVLRFFEDLTETETARMLGVTVGTVKSQTAKALAKLRVDPLLEERS